MVRSAEGGRRFERGVRGGSTSGLLMARGGGETAAVGSAGLESRKAERFESE